MHYTLTLSSDYRLKEKNKAWIAPVFPDSAKLKLVYTLFEACQIKNCQQSESHCHLFNLFVSKFVQKSQTVARVCLCICAVPDRDSTVSVDIFYCLYVCIQLRVAVQVSSTAPL